MIRHRRSEKGQAMVETALAVPIMVLLIGGMILAAVYAFRSAAANWGIFTSGAASGSYTGSAANRVLSFVPWEGIRSKITTGSEGRFSYSKISIGYKPIGDVESLSEAQGAETQLASAFFRLWRFYPGKDGGR